VAVVAYRPPPGNSGDERVKETAIGRLNNLVFIAFSTSSTFGSPTTVVRNVDRLV